ncbi:MAG: VWA domain-containing protein [Gemmatimonadaceae bacterium]
MKLKLRTDRTLIRAAARSTRYVAVSLTAPEAPRRASRIPVNVALVLDRSGSMEGEKFCLARQAVQQSLRMLQSTDRFALVVYDSEVDVLVESTLATHDAKARALDMLGLIHPRGSTDLAGGWFRGCEQVAEHATEGSVNRCLLLTDGLANQGITNRDELARHAGALRERGVQTSTFGVGADFDERLLRDMAVAAAGHFYFIESPIQIPDLLTSELGEALEVVIRGAALEVTLPRGAVAAPLHRFRHRRIEGDNELRVELGDVVSGQQMSVVITIELPTGVEGESVTAGFALTDQNSTTLSPAAELRWKWAGHAENDAQPRDLEVDRQVAALYAARAREEATEYNRAGEYDRARRAIVGTAKRIRSYAGNDGELNRMADQLLREQEMFAERPLLPMELKQQAFMAYAAVNERDMSGKARRH